MLNTHPTRKSGWNWLIWGLVALFVIGTIGNSTAKPKPRGRTAAGESRLQSATGPVPSAVASERARVVNTPRPTASRKPAVRTTGAIVVTASGAILPNRARTPGAVNPTVTQANIHSTICVTGWTSTVRPSSSYTTGIKEKQLASGYAFHSDKNTGDYEEDHLISLELGGSPTSVLNLWPEPYEATDGARTKDQIENKLKTLVCSGSVSLATARHAIASNWWVAYNAYDAAQSLTPTTRNTPPPAPRPVSTPPPAPAGRPGGATALCNDGTYSHAAHHQGACSHHGGVAVFYT